MGYIAIVTLIFSAIGMGAGLTILFLVWPRK